MKNRIRAFLSVAFCLILALGSSLSLFGSEAAAGERGAKEIILFGSYPQRMVDDEELIAELNECDGEWISYDYYSGTDISDDGMMAPSDYMKYKDVTIGNEKFRGVLFTAYRPRVTGGKNSSSVEYSRFFQYSNGYRAKNIYWFRFEPIRWRVLDRSKGLVISEDIIDSQAFSNFILKDGVDSHGLGLAYWGNPEKTFYACNYKESSIRNWLNNEFYNTAFSQEQKSNIEATLLDNSCANENYNGFSSEPTTDPVFLLSYKEAKSQANGFNTNSSENDEERCAKGTDYAKCQGLEVLQEDGSQYNSHWWLRSSGEGSNYIRTVFPSGGINVLYNSGKTNIGVRPAIVMKNTVSEFNISYSWSKNSQNCTAIAEYKKDNRYNIYETGKMSSRVAVKPTCEGWGTTEYTADFENPIFSMQRNSATDIKPTDHYYYITYEWSNDCSKCFARGVCLNDNSHIIEEESASSYAVTAFPDCVNDGTTVYTAQFANELFPVQQKETNNPSAWGHDFTNYIYNNNSAVGVNGSETAKCNRCEETHTREKSGTAKPLPIIKIVNSEKYNGKSIEYRASLTVYAQVENCTDAKWVVEGASFTDNGNSSITLNEVKNNFSIHLIANDLDGKSISSAIESVTVKKGFFDKLVAFFQSLFGGLPKYTQ